MTMRNILKKWIALLLALCLLTGCLAALADDEVEEAVEAVEVEEKAASSESSEPKAETKTDAAEPSEPKAEAKTNAGESDEAENTEKPDPVIVGEVSGKTGLDINNDKVYIDDQEKLSTSESEITVKADSVKVQGSASGTLPIGVKINTHYCEDLKNFEIDVTGDVSVTAETRTVEGILSNLEKSDETAKIEVGGSVTAETEGSYSDAYGVDVQGKGTAEVDVTGNISVSSQGYFAKGIRISGTGDNTVQVGGNVKATAEGGETKGYGLDVSSLSEGGKASVLIDGTLSGSDAAVYVGEHTEGVDLIVWEAKENDAGEIVQSSNNDSEAASAFEKAISYIVRASEWWTDKHSVTAPEIRTVDGKEYALAHEGEEVTVMLDDYEDGDTLAFYYSDEDDTAMTKADTAGEGTYSLVGNVVTLLMKSGGGMKLLAKITKAQKEEELLPVVTVEDPKPEDPKPEETKPEDPEPEDLKPEETKPEETKPEETKPEETKPEETEPEETQPEETKPEETKPEETQPEETEPEETPAETTADDEDEEETHSTPKPVFVYVAIPEAHGLSSAGRPAAADAIAALGDSLSGEGATADLVDKRKLMNEGEIARFDALPVAERVRVALALMGLENVAGELSEAGRALVDDVNARVAGLTDAERRTRQAAIDAGFQPRLIIVDGVERVSVGLELKVVSGGKTTRERYTFFDDGGTWKLYQIERGVYRQS